MPYLTCWPLLLSTIGSTTSPGPVPGPVHECDSLIQSLMPGTVLLADDEGEALMQEPREAARDEVMRHFLEQVGVVSSAAQRGATREAVELLGAEGRSLSIGQTLGALKRLKDDPLVALVQQSDPQKIAEGLEVVRAELPRRAAGHEETLKERLLAKVQRSLREERLPGGAEQLLAKAHGSLDTMVALRLAGDGDVDGDVEACPEAGAAGALEALHSYASGGCGRVHQALVLVVLGLPCTCCCLTLICYCCWASLWICTWYWCCLKGPEPKEGVRPLLPDKQPGAKDPPLFRPAAAKQPPLTVPRREEQTSIPPRSTAPCVESARL